MPIFRRRIGGTGTRQEDYYRREHTEETVRKLKELGVTLAIIHFYTRSPGEQSRTLRRTFGTDHRFETMSDEGG